MGGCQRLECVKYNVTIQAQPIIHLKPRSDRLQSVPATASPSVTLSPDIRLVDSVVELIKAEGDRWANYSNRYGYDKCPSVWVSTEECEVDGTIAKNM